MTTGTGLDFGFHRIYVEGRLRTREYAGPDGLRSATTEIVADIVSLLQPRADGEAAGEPGTAREVRS